MAMLFDLSTKVAILMGASKGIGLAMATPLAQHGATVVISARKEEQLNIAVIEIDAVCGTNRAIAVPANTGNKEDLENLVQTTHRSAGSIDIVIGNACVNPYYGPTSQISDAAYEKTMATNVQSNLWLAQLTIADMVAKGNVS